MFGEGGDNGLAEENMHQPLTHSGVTNSLQVSLWDYWGFQQFVCNTFTATGILVQTSNIKKNMHQTLFSIRKKTTLQAAQSALD